MSRLCMILYAIAVLMVISLSAASYPRDQDDKQFAREKVKIADMAAKCDTAGLQAMLSSSEFRSTELAAYWLGRLGIEEALPQLDRMHEFNAHLVCPEPSGAFGAAAARIRVKDLPLSEQVNELLKLAADTNPDRVLSSEVGRILIDFNDPRIASSLRYTRTYGGQETAVRLEMGGFPEDKQFAFLIDTLLKIETPQRAQAAQLLLTEAGKAGADAIMGLLDDESWEKDNPDIATIKNCAFHIVSQVGTEAQKERLCAEKLAWGSQLPIQKTHKIIRDEKKLLAAIARLSDKDYLIRFRAALELRDMPPDVRSIPALIKNVDDSEVIVENLALEALAKIKSEKVIPIMQRKLKSPRREFRYLAAEALWTRGYKRSVRVIIADLRSEDAEIRKRADKRLEMLTGRTSDYWYGDPISEREKNVKLWENWLTKQKR